MTGDRRFIRAMRMGITRMVEWGNVPEAWEMSRMSMMPKVKKP